MSLISCGCLVIILGSSIHGHIFVTISLSIALILLCHLFYSSHSTIHIKLKSHNQQVFKQTQQTGVHCNVDWRKQNGGMVSSPNCGANDQSSHSQKTYSWHLGGRDLHGNSTHHHHQLWFGSQQRRFRSENLDWAAHTHPPQQPHTVVHFFFLSLHPTCHLKTRCILRSI